MPIIVIPGKPVPKPRGQRSDKWLKPPRPCIVRYREFKDRVKRAAQGKLDYVMETGEITQILIFLEFPKSWSKNRRDGERNEPAMQGRNDLDNYLKGILDTLFPENDGFIWKIGNLEKRWDDGQGPRIEIHL